MTYVIVPKVTFEKPTIGARDYLSATGSGWPERFAIHEADLKLSSFVDGLALGDLLDNFAEHVELNCKGRESWSDVIGYLGRITDTDPAEVSCDVGIAFWAKLVERKSAIETAPKKRKGKKAC